MSSQLKKARAGKRRESFGETGDLPESSKRPRTDETGSDFQDDGTVTGNSTSDIVNVSPVPTDQDTFTKDCTLIIQNVKVPVNLSDEKLWRKIVLNALPSFPIQSVTRTCFSTWNDNIFPLESFNFQEREYSEEVKCRFIVRSLNDGGENVYNILTVKPDNLKITEGYLNLSGKKTVASVFYLTGCTSYSALTECNNNFGIYSVAVKPWEFTWPHIFPTIASAFNVKDVYIKTLAKGIYFKTAQKDSKTSTAGPLKPSAPGMRPYFCNVYVADEPILVVFPKDGTDVFKVSKIDNLPDLSGELQEGTPVLVTFCVRLTDWRPKPENKNCFKRFENGCRKQLSFYIRNVVALAKTEIYEDMESIDAKGGDTEREL